jgi:ceramide glucosyltransferase
MPAELVRAELHGRVQILFGVASADDPVCDGRAQASRGFPGIDSQLVVCGPCVGQMPKSPSLVELERLAKHELLVISDADVRVPPDLLASLVETAPRTGRRPRYPPR